MFFPWVSLIGERGRSDAMFYEERTSSEFNLCQKISCQEFVGGNGPLSHLTMRLSSPLKHSFSMCFTLLS